MRDKQLLDLARPAGGGCGAARILTRGRARLGAAATVVALAFVVALAVKRSPPRFAAPPIAIVRDTAGDALWSVRLAVTAHEISADRLAAPPQPGP
ncbi:MAG TPA: hypothetical protein VME41_11890, partial [Stellaceae bacterium]|nr:hypothetical protein [Stellaceae bacterium]